MNGEEVWLVDAPGLLDGDKDDHQTMRTILDEVKNIKGNLTIIFPLSILDLRFDEAQ